MARQQNNEWSKDFCDERHSQIKENVDKLEKSHENTQDELKTTQAKFDEKISKIDDVFRGDPEGNKVGIFEQLRIIRKALYIAYILIILLFGFKVSGISIDDIHNVLFNDIKIENSEENYDIQE